MKVTSFGEVLWAVGGGCPPATPVFARVYA